jgi:hypothetical protein
MQCFRPLENFEDKKLRCVYMKGKTYTIRKGNKMLLEKVKKWLEEGKVEIVLVETQRAKISGRGAVQ